MESAIVNVYLLWGAWRDLKKRKIKNEFLWIGGIAGFVYKSIGMAVSSDFFKEWVLALIPGVLILLLAKATREKIGFGDGWVLLILGNFLNIVEVWYILQTAVFLVMFFSLVLLCSKRAGKEYQIPFLPFLWGAHTLFWGLNYV